MPKKFLWVLFSLVTVVALVIASCAQKTQPTTAPTTAQTTTTTTKPVTPPTSTTAIPTTTPAIKPTTGTETPIYGGTLRYGTHYLLPSFESLQAGSTTDTALAFVYEKVGIGDWTRGPAGTNEWPFSESSYMPEKYRTTNLAESWELPDPQTIIFHLRKGINFHNISPVNGREMVADDVVASWKRYSSSTLHENDKIRTLPDSITALDKYTVEVKLKSVYYDPIYPFSFSTRNFIHAADMLTYTKGNLIDYKNACGTGPFIAVDYVPDSFILFKKNPNYWRHDELNPKNQLPYVDEVQYLMIVDWSTMMSAMRTGKIDWLPDVAPEQAISLKSTNPEFKFVVAIQPTAYPKITFRNDLKPFNDIRVRKALTMAIDRETIIKEYLKGQGISLSWPMSAGWGEDIYTPMEKLPVGIREIYEYHPDKAKQLLTEAGYPNGFTTEVLTYGDFVDRTVVVASYWSKIGVDCKIRVAERASYLNEIYGRKYPAMCSASAGQSDPINTLSYYLSTAYYNYGEGRYPYYDETMAKITSTLDAVDRTKLVKGINVWFLENVVNIAFPAQYVHNFWQPWVKNFHGERSLGGSGTVAPIITRLWVDQALKKSMGR